EVDLGELAQQQAGMAGKLGAVDQREQRVGARHQFSFGLDQDAVGLQQAALADGGSTDEHPARVEMIETIIVERAQNDVLLGEYAAAGHSQLDVGLAHQRVDDMQRISQ